MSGRSTFTIQETMLLPRKPCAKTHFGGEIYMTEVSRTELRINKRPAEVTERRSMRARQLTGTLSTAFAALTLLLNVGAAREIHVAKNGNDGNSGTASSPLLTIMAAAEIAWPGDVITVHRGIYREEVNPPRGGTSDDSRIVYQAAPGEPVEIRGSEPVTGWEKDGEDVWKTEIPNTLFGDFNPFADVVSGNWFKDKGRDHHTGCVYLDGEWLFEAASREEVPNAKWPMAWYAKVAAETTTVWATFDGKNPNDHVTEVNVRQTVFYPRKPFLNYITVRGFKMRHAAPKWAPPTAEQMGLIGTHWSKGWIIEDNEISHSINAGVSLGKYGDEFDNTERNRPGLSRFDRPRPQQRLEQGNRRQPHRAEQRNLLVRTGGHRGQHGGVVRRDHR